MIDNPLRIGRKILYKMKKVIKIKPTIALSVIDALDVYNLKKSSPFTQDERKYRVCLSHLPNDKLVNRFAVKMKDFDIHIGTNIISIKEITLLKMKKWKDYKAIQHHLKDFKPYEEVTAIDINQFIKFCQDNLITEEMLWQLLLDDTYSKSEEILFCFYPTIIPLPHYMTRLQKYNSHGLLFTQAKTGKSETCYRLYPKENYEDVSIVTLLGTADKNVKRTGLLDGSGMFFIDEINKIKYMRAGNEENLKIMDFINTYLEKGIEKRGVWGQSISVEGTKTIIFSGNVNVTRPGQKDFYHLMSKICTFSGDADKFGRRISFFIYSTNLNYVDEGREVDYEIINIINCFRNELIRDKKIQKKILKLIDSKLDWVIEKDTEHKKKILEFRDRINSDAIQSFITGMSLSSYMKLKFMALRITINKHIFSIIKKGTEDFFDEYNDELNDLYERLKEVLCYRQLENLLQTIPDDKRSKFEEFIKINEINLNERIDMDTKEKWSKELNIPVTYLNKLITECKIKPSS